MPERQKLVAALLVAAGIYSEANAAAYAASLPAIKADALIRSLTENPSRASDGSVLMGGQPGGPGK